MSILSTRIRNLREDNDLTQIEFARKLNIGNSTLSQYESGIRVPSDDMKIRIADYFHVSIDYLLGKTDIMNSEKGTISDHDIKVALFNGNTNVTDEMWREVKKFADYVNQMHEDEKKD